MATDEIESCHLRYQKQGLFSRINYGNCGKNGLFSYSFSTFRMVTHHGFYAMYQAVNRAVMTASCRCGRKALMAML